ncbi:hypothetical protein LDENG_00198240 [Lucifuga dentata]|nr:hypothetical protein LDENG_00198240 [Lucifuga dentata]
MVPLGSIFRKHGISFLCYADNTQIYLPLTQKSKNSLNSILDYLEDFKAWMSLNFLKLNKDKTEILLGLELRLSS